MAEEKSKLTSNNIWKVVLTILIIFLSIFFIFGLIGRAIQVGLQNQSKKVDQQMSKLITAKVVTNEKEFVRIAKYKSKVYFFKHTIPPMIILSVTLIMWLICMSINNWSQSMFVLLGQMIYPWEGAPTFIPPLGFDFSSVTANYVDMSNWFSIMTLITLGLFFVGIIYYFIEVSGFLARKFRIRKLSRTMFSRNLDMVV